MFRAIFLTLFLCLSSWVHAETSGNPVGFWQLADKSGKPVLIIRIFPVGKTLSAKILQYYPNANARCTACKDALKDTPVRGLTFIKGLVRKSGDTWSDGKILNPETGKEAKVTLTISADGSQLKINSYRFLSWFGSTDIWTRRK
ncbi:DUF2147 domain-containing protein [Suttonella ornithocola]|uniref:Uncharacterized protein conserved in bacteria n=1 Tax=Suttonella ornithocola TaxID=279832 RepID=A0A380MMG9_9GAMM|nr:DUF2147 domain-containing protein [Suttonella ornithocola]SUO93810.1 Uncharacterized protein conserved in bacteria [Suttonella ornithocola]